jgi:hypothetical protein
MLIQKPTFLLAVMGLAAALPNSLTKRGIPFTCDPDDFGNQNTALCCAQGMAALGIPGGTLGCKSTTFLLRRGF